MEALAYTAIPGGQKQDVMRQSELTVCILCCRAVMVRNPKCFSIAWNCTFLQGTQGVCFESYPKLSLGDISFKCCTVIDRLLRSVIYEVALIPAWRLSNKYINACSILQPVAQLQFLNQTSANHSTYMIHPWCTVPLKRKHIHEMDRYEILKEKLPCNLFTCWQYIIRKHLNTETSHYGQGKKGKSINS